MYFDKLQDSLYELIRKIRVLDFLSEFCEYIIYFFVIVKVISSFIFLGGMVEAIVYYLTFVLIILAFSKKNYIPLIVLFIGNTICSLHEVGSIMLNQYFLRHSFYEPFPFWQSVFSIAINIFFATLFLVLLKNKKKAK